MAIIVEYTKSENRYILLGAGYGQWAMARPNRVLGDLFASDKTGDTHLLCVCDGDGSVYWMGPEDARIVSVDGEAPERVLSDPG